MKKILSLVLVLTLVLGMALSLTSCAKMLSGTYSAEVFGVEVAYEFEGSKVTLTVDAPVVEALVFEGTYEIKGEEGDYEITFTFEGSDDEEAEKYSGTHSFSEGEEDGVKYIKIDGAKYTKE